MALFRGVCDLTAQSAFKLGGMMPPDQRDAVNPLRRVQRGLPPLFASHGGRDRLLPWRNSERLAELWRKRRTVPDLNFWTWRTTHFTISM